MNKLLHLLMTMFIVSSFTIECRVVRVRNECQFYRLINKKSLAIVMFYKDSYCSHCACDPQLCFSRNCFDRASRSPMFQDGDLMFIEVNTSMHKDLSSLACRYVIANFPTFILFYQSVPVTNAQGAMVKLSGFVNRFRLEKWIDENVGGYLEDNIQARAEQRQVAREQAEINSLYYAPYFYWGGWPYGCGCGGYPVFGFGIGFGNYYY